MKHLTTYKGVDRALYFVTFLLHSSPSPLPCYAFSKTISRHHHNGIRSQLFVGRNRRSSHSDTSSRVPSKDGALDNLALREEEARRRRTGQAKQRLEKSVRREERISVLEEMGEDLSTAEMAELKGLLWVREEPL